MGLGDGPFAGFVLELELCLKDGPAQALHAVQFPDALAEQLFAIFSISATVLRSQKPLMKLACGLSGKRLL